MGASIDDFEIRRMLSGNECMEFSSVLELYVGSRLLSDFMLDQLKPVFSVAQENWRRLHAPGAEVGFSLIAQNLQGAVSGVRAWGDTWLAQHLALAPGANATLASALRYRWLETVIARPDTQSIAFYVDIENVAMNAGQMRLLRRKSAAGAFSRVPLGLWRCPFLSNPESPPGWALRPLIGADDERMAADAADRSLNAPAAQALSRTAGQFDLAANNAAFARLGLERKRSAFVLENNARSVAMVLLKEECSPGINLTGLMNTWWLLPVHADLQSSAVEAAVVFIAQLSASREACNRVIAPASISPRLFESSGLVQLTRMYLYAMNRAFAHEYRDDYAARYDGLTRRLKRLARRERERSL